MADVILEGLEGRAQEIIAEMVSTSVVGEWHEPIRYAALPPELSAIAHEHLAAFIRAAREEGPPDPATLRISRDRAADRAREMVPLASIVNSHLVASAVIIRALGLEASRNEMTSVALGLAALLVDHAAATVGQAIEGYTEVTDGERADRDAARRAVLAELIRYPSNGDSTLASRAATLGLEVGRDAVVVCVKLFRPDGEVDGPSTIRWAAGVVALASARTASRAFVVARTEDLVAVLNSAGPRSVSAVLTELVAAAEQRNVEVRAGAGSVFGDLDGVADSYNQAVRALRHTSHVRPIVWDPNEITMLDELVLSYADSGHQLIPADTQLVLQDPTVRSTLEAFLDSNLNVADAAKALFLHPNGLRYRLAAIARSTGLNPRKPCDLFELCAAARIVEAGSGR